MAEEAHKLKLEGMSIVALGAFNPAIFQPMWFAANNLLRKKEASDAKIEIIHRDVAKFSTEWCSLQVTAEMFNVETADPSTGQAERSLPWDV